MFIIVETLTPVWAGFVSRYVTDPLDPPTPFVEGSSIGETQRPLFRSRPFILSSPYP